MKTYNSLDGVSGSGLYFITSGEVQRAIGRQDPFSKVVDPEERAKKVEKLSQAIQKAVNANVKGKLASIAAQEAAKK